MSSRYVLLLLVLFFIPGVVMIVAYGLISRELYRGIRFELDIKGEAAGEGPGWCRAGLGAPLGPALAFRSVTPARAEPPAPGRGGGLSPTPGPHNWGVPWGPLPARDPVPHPIPTPRCIPLEDALVASG